MNPVRAVVALGSNLDQPERQIDIALRYLDKGLALGRPGVNVLVYGLNH